LVREPTSVAALEMFLTQQLEAAAGVRQSLAAFARNHANLRLFADRFMLIEQAVGTPAGRPAAVRYLRAFVEEMKSSGFVERALHESGQRDAAVAPAAR
jgi:polar amino acid transport system substrate-binding protein